MMFLPRMDLAEPDQTFRKFVCGFCHPASALCARHWPGSPVRLFWSHDLAIITGCLFVETHDPPPDPLRTRQILPATPLAFFALNTTASEFRVKKSCSVVCGSGCEASGRKVFLFSVVISVVFSVRSSGHFDPMTLGRLNQWSVSF